jgi:hypothetical protein
MNMHRPLLAATALTLPFVTITHALADDYKTYPGTFCQTNTPSIAVYDSFGGICNTSNSADLIVRCPVVRDEPDGGFPNEVRHSGRSGNKDERVKCVLRNMRTFASNGAGPSNTGVGMAAFFANLTDISYTDNADFQVQHVFTHLSGIGDIPFGAYVLTCTLPNSFVVVGGQQVQSCLYNYSIRELD